MLALLGAGVLSLAVLPQVAEANSASADSKALNAYRTYLTSLTGLQHSAEQGAEAIVEGVSDDCPNVLSDLNKRSSSQVSKAALTAFGNEVDADLTIAYLSPSAGALNLFGGALKGLKWSTAAQSATSTRMITTERALLNLATPDLCADANALDAAPLSEPASTKSFLSRYQAAARNQNKALSAFQALLGRYETKAEAKVVAQINSLASAFSSQSGATQQSDAAAVLSALGLAES